MRWCACVQCGICFPTTILDSIWAKIMIFSHHFRVRNCVMSFSYFVLYGAKKSLLQHMINGRQNQSPPFFQFLISFHLALSGLSCIREGRSASLFTLFFNSDFFFFFFPMKQMFDRWSGPLSRGRAGTRCRWARREHSGQPSPRRSRRRCFEKKVGGAYCTCYCSFFHSTLHCGSIVRATAAIPVQSVFSYRPHLAKPHDPRITAPCTRM